MCKYNYKKILNEIKNLDCKIFKNESMKKHTTIKIGGSADIFLNVNTENTLTYILKILNDEKIPFYILGNGSNLLVGDKGISGVVIKLDGEFKKITTDLNQQITCGAGASITRLCLYAYKNSLTGVEFLYGIPGTIGGAVYMNAGAYNGEIKDVIVNCTHITGSGEKVTLSKDELNFSYRHSFYSDKDYIITQATFKLSEKEKTAVQKTMDDLMQRRKAKQPLNYPNAGSIFKRPIGNFAGALIEKAGLNGKTIGGAMVSEKHCGFIINKNKASCEDVLNLMELIKEEVYKKTGVLLENEVKVIGDNFKLP